MPVHKLRVAVHSAQRRGWARGRSAYPPPESLPQRRNNTRYASRHGPLRLGLLQQKQQTSGQCDSFKVEKKQLSIHNTCRPTKKLLFPTIFPLSPYCGTYKSRTASKSIVCKIEICFSQQNCTSTCCLDKCKGVYFDAQREGFAGVRLRGTGQVLQTALTSDNDQSTHE